jgi:uncharacterized protein involved in outer membrane biogenesis
MRKILMIAGAVVGLIILVIVGLLTYAVVNLNSIVASNRAYILARASDAMGRPVQARDIKASIGWGVKMDVAGVQVADDSAFSQLPFLRANDVYVNVEFLPLLSRSLRVTSLVVNHPQVRVIRNAAGVLNISTMGQARGAPKPKTPSNPTGAGGNAAGLAALTVSSLKIDDGTIYYQDERAGGPPVTINAFDLDVEHFSANAPFDVALALAAFNDRQDLNIAGKMGPLMQNGAVDIGAAPIAFHGSAGPLTLAQLKSVPQLAKAIPPALSISDPVTVVAKAGGTVDSATIGASGDLTSNHVVYQGIFDKARGLPFKFNGSGTRGNGKIELRQASVIFADMNAKITRVTFGDGNIAARVDTNNFNLTGIGKTLIAAQKYNLTGNAEVHSDVRLANHQPSANGAITLANVNAAMPGAKMPPLSNLSGTIHMAGNSATAGPMTFNLGSGHAKLQALAHSLQPLKATYQFSADTVKIGELAPSRQQLGEQVNQLQASGGLSRDGGALAATTNATSASGMVANVPYQNLALAAIYGGNRVTINSLKLNTFDGAIGASGFAGLAGDRAFNLKFNAGNIDVKKALEAQKAKAAETIRGRLTGNVQVAGAGASFDQIKPALRGNGSATLSDGKLVGVNVVAQALKKVGNVPQIGALVPASVVNNHPELFKSNDTDIQQAKLTFVLQGPRITTHDLTARTADYSILGDGWFDMDKNVDMAARILMSPAFSSELVAAKRNAAFLENRDKQLEIPLRIAGQLPKPAVLPDVNVLAQRAASNALQGKLGGFLGKKAGAFGGLFGKGEEPPPGSVGGPAPKSQPTSSNPLNQFKGLFH